MSYQIAVASTDRVHIDVTFGGALEFMIYEVTDSREYHLLEIRTRQQEGNVEETQREENREMNGSAYLPEDCETKGNVCCPGNRETGEIGHCPGNQEIKEIGHCLGNQEIGRSSRCHGGCDHKDVNNNFIEIIADCRCVICKKIGFQVQKQLEKKAITSFDLEGTIIPCLDKITTYFHRMDHHQSLRGMVN